MVGSMANYKLFFDGSCGPKNPGGTAAYGFALMGEGLEAPLEYGAGVIGSGPGMSNNVAEFHALLKGFEAFNRVRVLTSDRYDNLHVHGDSKLVIEVMSRRWKAKPDKLYFETYALADGWLSDLRKDRARVSFDWIPREMNTICDDLSKAHNRA